MHKGERSEHGPRITCNLHVKANRKATKNDTKSGRKLLPRGTPGTQNRSKKAPGTLPWRPGPLGVDNQVHRAPFLTRTWVPQRL